MVDDRSESVVVALLMTDEKRVSRDGRKVWIRVVRLRREVRKAVSWRVMGVVTLNVVLVDEGVRRLGRGVDRGGGEAKRRSSLSSSLEETAEVKESADLGV